MPLAHMARSCLRASAPAVPSAWNTSPQVPTEQYLAYIWCLIHVWLNRTTQRVIVSLCEMRSCTEQMLLLRYPGRSGVSGSLRGAEGVLSVEGSPSLSRRDLDQNADQDGAPAKLGHPRSGNPAWGAWANPGRLPGGGVLFQKKLVRTGFKPRPGTFVLSPAYVLGWLWVGGQRNGCDTHPGLCPLPTCL